MLNVIVHNKLTHNCTGGISLMKGCQITVLPLKGFLSYMSFVHITQSLYCSQNINTNKTTLKLSQDLNTMEYLGENYRYVTPTDTVMTGTCELLFI